MSRAQTTAVGLVLIAVVMGIVMGSKRAPEPSSDSPPSLPTSTLAGQRLRVYVSGWVASPGVVELPEGAIVAEAIAAAGGALGGAGLDTINLAAVVGEGDHIHVPGLEAAADGVARAADDGLISLNRASATELEALPGVGPVLAQRIVSYRDGSGRFESVEDLLDVPGIGEAKLAAIRDLISVP